MLSSSPLSAQVCSAFAEALPMLAAALSARGTPASVRRYLPCMSSVEAYHGLLRSPQAAPKTSLFFTFHSTGIRSVGLGSRKAKLFGTDPEVTKP